MKVTKRVNAYDEVSVAHKPMRGDDVEAWIKRARNAEQRYCQGYTFDTLDGLLDDYRLHADTGTPLSEEVSERYVDSRDP